MSTSENFISAPTSRSVGLLARILSIYPTLHPILFHSHRSDIIHLAHTCRTFNSILTTSIAPLKTPFPSCTLSLELCQLCQAIVCADCRQEAVELEKLSAVMSRLQIHKALLIEPSFKPESMKGDLVRSYLYEAKHKLGWQIRSVRIMQAFKPKTLCGSCFTMHNNARMCSRVPVEERVITVPTIEWRDVLETHTMCGCNGQAQCAGDKRLVDISNVPVESELVALVKLPREQRSGSEVMGVCALYMLGDLCPHYFAHWVKKVDRNQSVRYGF